MPRLAICVTTSVIVAMALVAPLTASADDSIRVRVRLKNGKRVTGKLKKLTDDSIHIKVKATPRRFKPTEIEEMVFIPNAAVEPKDERAKKTLKPLALYASILHLTDQLFGDMAATLVREAAEQFASGKVQGGKPHFQVFPRAMFVGIMQSADDVNKAEAKKRGVVWPMKKDAADAKRSRASVYVAYYPRFKLAALHQVLPKGGFVVSQPHNVMTGTLMVFYFTPDLRVAGMYSTHLILPK